MLTPEERADLLDPEYRESLRRDFEAFDEFMRKNPPPPMSLDDYIDWVTAMSEMFPSLEPREFIVDNGKMVF